MSSGYKNVDYKGWLDNCASPCNGDPVDAFRVAEQSIRSMEPQYRHWIKNVLSELAERVVEYSSHDNCDHVLRYIREIAHELRGTTGTFGRDKTSLVAKGLYELAADGPGTDRKTFIEAVWVYYHALMKLAEKDGGDADPQLEKMLSGLDRVRAVAAGQGNTIQ